MFDWKSPAEWQQLWRYYQAGVVNTLFGFGLYAVLVRAGLNLYVAQGLAQIAGIAFNYLTYGRYTFANQTVSRGRFIASYAVNFLLGLAGLAACKQIIASPYVAGICSIAVVSLINYFILKRYVYRTEDDRP
jgi:putative flippase GtrA